MRGWRRGFGRLAYVQPAIVQPPHQPAYQPVAQPQTPEQEIAALENYKKELEAEKTDLEQEMGGVKARIEELKGEIEKSTNES
jgi:peptidoglycan hydrolase CwlO-like protein